MLLCLRKKDSLYIKKNIYFCQAYVVLAEALTAIAEENAPEHHEYKVQGGIDK